MVAPAANATEEGAEPAIVSLVSVTFTFTVRAPSVCPLRVSVKVAAAPSATDSASATIVTSGKGAVAHVTWTSS